MEQFQENIKKWVSLDTQLKNINNEAKNIRSQKQELNENIYEFVNTNNLSTNSVRISDGRLKFQTIKQTSPLTLGHVQGCLLDLFTEEETDKIMEHIRNKRNVKEIKDIKRFYDN